MSPWVGIIFASICAQTVVQAALTSVYSVKCPYVNPICLCIPQEHCKADNECTNGQKCCMDCCGGHKCTDPVDARCTKPNEVYNGCGSHCPPTCPKSPPGPCILSCKSGCFCKNGYLRNAAGECIAEKDCAGYKT